MVFVEFSPQGLVRVLASQTPPGGEKLRSNRFFFEIRYFAKKCLIIGPFCCERIRKG